MDKTLQFLALAQRAAGTRNVFRWRDIGAALGCSPQESENIAVALDRAAAICLPTDYLGQMLPAGREMLRQGTAVAAHPGRDNHKPNKRNHKHKPARARVKRRRLKGRR